MHNKNFDMHNKIGTEILKQSAKFLKHEDKKIPVEILKGTVENYIKSAMKNNGGGFDKSQLADYVNPEYQNKIKINNKSNNTNHHYGLIEAHNPLNYKDIVLYKFSSFTL